MTTTETVKKSTNIPYPRLEENHGFFNSASVLLSPDKVFELCQKDENVEKVLTDLPGEIENYLDLTLVSAEKIENGLYEIKWKNKVGSKVSGTLHFQIHQAPSDRGSILIAEAIFDNFTTKGKDPSDLMKLFLKRMKALLETGVIATTKGQPTGKEEIKSEKELLH